MKRLINKLMVLAFAMAVLVVAAPVVASAKPSVPSTITLYANPSGESGTSIYIGNLKKDSKITSVKSSDKKIVAPTSKTFYSYSSVYFDSNDKYSDYSGYIYTSVKKAGTATVSFKVDGTSYKTKVVVKKYTNPAKSFKISGTEIASKFNKLRYVDTGKKPSKTVKNAKFTVKAKSGWKVTNLNVYDGTSYHSASIGNSNGLGSRTLVLDKFEKGHYYTIEATFTNKSNNASITLHYELRK